MRNLHNTPNVGGLFGEKKFNQGSTMIVEGIAICKSALNFIERTISEQHLQKS